MTFRTNTMKYNIGDRIKHGDPDIVVYEGVIVGYIHWPTIIYADGKPCNYIVVDDNGEECEVFENCVLEVIHV